MNHTLILSILLCFGTVSAYAQSSSADAADEKTAIEHVMRAQVEAWNRHDLDGFMAGYWNSPELTFFSGAKQTSGWQATLDRYRSDVCESGA